MPMTVAASSCEKPSTVVNRKACRTPGDREARFRSNADCSDEFDEVVTDRLRPDAEIELIERLMRRKVAGICGPIAQQTFQGRRHVGVAFR